ncbi:hypothetical protein [Paenibacillus radicis (ex Gao et al. 2016)]|uniref:Uncharacterized protein n=1 Tax=Paenibacillus radicis (ex Gao et al. 2016) TaxID=1737354 RepID=A0A917H8P2_9BACL|nr:hypothetical protein [Paenibacillus radicis (ex Gao et al. 2016)]GGG70756.1 hypothetical protein GCM10010918_27740 [Paenibacillus radicis (ex Gao et al. 2016)]
MENKDETNRPLSDKREATNRFFTKEGKPIRVLSTSLGIALMANALIGLAPSTHAAAETTNASSAEGPALIEWSTDAVKAYYDPAVDWNIPILLAESAGEENGSGEGGTSGSGGTTVIHSGGGFGWNDLLLYHLIFNRGNSYSSGAWHNSHNSYYQGSRTAYKPKSYDTDKFQNKAVVGSAVRPKTSNKSGSITRRSTSSSPGGIGGKSSGLSSSGSGSSFSSSGSGHKASSGGFGG